MTAEQLVTWVVGAIVGALEVPIFQWIKGKLGVSDKAAFVSVIVFSIILALGALLVTGGFSPFDWNNLFVYLASIVALGQVTFNLFLK